MSEDFTPVEKVEPPCQILYLQSSSGKVYRCYRTSEADKVIAEKDAKILALDAEVAKQKHHAELFFDERNYAETQLRHSNRKRCLAMAWWCEATALWCYQAANTLPAGFHATLYGKPVMIEPDRLFKRHALLTKWSAKWRELAEKFKENV